METAAISATVELRSMIALFERPNPERAGPWIREVAKGARCADDKRASSWAPEHPQMRGKKRLAAAGRFDAFCQPAGDKPFGFLNASRGWCQIRANRGCLRAMHAGSCLCCAAVPSRQHMEQASSTSGAPRVVSLIASATEI